MSSTTMKRPHAEALADAEALRSLFPPSMWGMWEIAGSVRRNKPEVGDVEHVIHPTNVDRFWARIESLLIDEGSMFPNESAVFTKAVYVVHPTDGSPVRTQHKWGQKYRGVMFRGFRHEIFLADGDNWGSILAIRTGSADFSARLVEQIKGHGYRQEGGYVVEAHNGQRVAVRTEEQFFSMCGEPWTEPEARQ